MQNKKLYADSSMIINAIARPKSNSALIMELVRERALEAATSEKTIAEVRNYFARIGMEKQAYLAERLIRQSFKIITIGDIQKEMRKWRGKIKTKDLEHLASAKKMKLQYIVAFDRDFEPFKEYRTPKQFVDELGVASKPTDY